MKKHLVIALLLSIGGIFALNSLLSLRLLISRQAIVSNALLQPGIFYNTGETAESLKPNELESRTLQQDYFWFVQGYTEQGEFIYEKSRDAAKTPVARDRLTLVWGYF
jgi:hypothetical protein